MTAHARALASIPVVYGDDHVPSPDEVDLPRKMVPFPIDLPGPPAPTTSSQTAKSETFSLTIKSLKPPVSFALENVAGTDSVLSIKERLAAEHSRAPSVDVQRLLLKGKVLADGKLLKEYLPSTGVTEDGITLSLMIKPGASWTAEEKPASVPAVSAASPGAQAAPKPDGLAPTSVQPSRSHSRTPSEGGAADQFPVPSLVLSTPMSPSDENAHKQSRPVPLDIADQSGSRPTTPSIPGGGVGGGLLTQPIFWVHLREFLLTEVELLRGREADADDLFESFLLASKGSLEATDIARIRDAVNITGMAGT